MRLSFIPTAALLSTLALPALTTERPCALADQMKAQLAAEFRESVVATGVSQTGELMLVFASPGGATWTVAVVDPRSKVARLVAAGLDRVIGRLPVDEGEGT